MNRHLAYGIGVVMALVGITIVVVYGHIGGTKGVTIGSVAAINYYLGYFSKRKE